jgi:hypothetical protein
MNVEPRLHHSAYKIFPNSLEAALEVFKIFECEVTFKPELNQRWVMIGQKGLRYDIQLVEYSATSTDLDSKTGTHLAFISSDPDGVIKKIEDWARDRNVKFIKGEWSKTEKYFDLPDIFINFVIEVMHTSVEEA